MSGTLPDAEQLRMLQYLLSAWDSMGGAAFEVAPDVILGAKEKKARDDTFVWLADHGWLEQVEPTDEERKLFAPTGTFYVPTQQTLTQRKRLAELVKELDRG